MFMKLSKLQRAQIAEARKHPHRIDNRTVVLLSPGMKFNTITEVIRLKVPKTEYLSPVKCHRIAVDIKGFLKKEHNINLSMVSIENKIYEHLNTV